MNDRYFRKSFSPGLGTALLTLALLVFAGGCNCLSGYHIGTTGLYNDSIETVYVPMVEANTYRHDFGERLTEAIVKKISEQTPYRIVGPKDPDSTLTVTLLGERQSVSVLDRYDNTRQKNIDMTARVVWRNNRTGTSPTEALAPGANTTILAQSFLVPEMGQSTETAQQEAIEKLAEQIVGLMETSW